MSYSIYLFSFLYATFNVAGAAIIKSKLLLGNIGTFKEFIFFLLDIKIILAMIFIFISMFFSIKALSLDKFSLVIPILTGVNFLVTVGVGYFFFKDELALTGYMGILFIIVGIYLLGLGK
jgi:multidrug transporter EmrE-like cation transporter